MTRAFNVVQAFKGTNVISGRKREFRLGEIVVSDNDEAEGRVTFEIERSFFVVEQSTFKACCKWKNDGAAPFF